MDAQIQCPVCTLYLHEGMSLNVHLDTHPKDQVIRALCALSSGGFEECGLEGGQVRRTSARPPRRTPSHTPSHGSRFSSRPSRTSSRASSVAPSVYSRSRSRSPYGREYRDCRECRDYRDCRCRPTPPPVYPSVSVQVSTNSNSDSSTALSTPSVPPATSVVPPAHPNAVNSIASINSIPVGPVSFMLPAPQTFDSSPKKNIVITSLPVNQAKKIITPVFGKIKSPSPFQQSSVFGSAPQIIYQKIVNDSAPKHYASTVPNIVSSSESIVTRSMASFQNVMVLQPYPKACFMPQQQPIGAFRSTVNTLQLQNFTDATEKTFSLGGVREDKGQSSDSLNFSKASPQSVSGDLRDKLSEVGKKFTPETGNKLSGLKILSDVKIEPTMMSDVIDLTLRSDSSKRNITFDISKSNFKNEESILPDMDETVCDSFAQSKFVNSFSTNLANSKRPANDIDENAEMGKSNFNISSNNSSNTFSVIKNIGNPSTFKPSISSFISNESSRNSLELIVPDITCTEKPRTNFTDGPVADSSAEEPRLEISVNEVFSETPRIKEEQSAFATLAKVPSKKNVYIRKSKKTLTIKNMKEKAKPSEDYNKPSSSTITESVTEKNITNVEENKTLTYSTYNFSTELTDLERVKNFNGPKPTHFLNNYLSQTDFELDEKSIKKSITDENNLQDNQILSDAIQDDQNYSSNKTDLLDNTNEDGTDVNTNFLSKIEDKSGIISADIEVVRPVNVIAFGSMNASNGDVSKLDVFPPFDDTSKNISSNDMEIDENKKEISSITNASFSNENSFSTSSQEKFLNNNNDEDDSAASENEDDENEITKEVHKIELPSIDDVPNPDEKYIWIDVAQKDEFPFSNLMQYNQNVYPKIDNCVDDREQINPNNKDYTELLCPRDNYLAQEDKSSFFNSLGKDKCVVNSSDALNIRTDEQMPSRGELSEQESSGDMDAPWAGMYRDSATFSDVVGSTSYDFLAHDTWPSDPSDVDMPNSPQKNLYSCQENDAENMPIVVSVKPPDKNYKCATCGKAFNCPKERRVHRSKEHPTNSSAKKIMKKSCFIPIKNNADNKTSIKIESITSLATSNSSLLNTPSNLDDPTRIDIKPLKTEFVNCKELEQTANTPTLDFVKVETDKKKPELTCPTCKADFPNLFQFNEHLKIHPLECLTCGKLFQRRTNLQLHLKRHYGIKDYKCAVCDKRFITKQKMIEHYNIHTGKLPIKCNLCDLFFRRHSNMVQHRNRHHLQLKKKLKDYICACGEVFHSKKKLAWHKEIHDDKPKACLHCNEKFIHMSSLTRHIRRTHNNYFVPDEKRLDENVQCVECNNVYLKSSIEMHMKTHSGSKPYSCVICNKSFTTKWNLKLHKWTHANRSSKPFKCNLCKGAFIRQVDYVSHMNAHKSVRPYTCNYCGCQFIRKNNCQRHVKEHENEKKYVCEVPDCGKTFHRSYYLTEHLTVHSGVRPFSCNICGKTSSTKSNHNKHVKIHHAREPVTTEG